MCTSETIKAADIMTRDVVCLNEELDLHECESILLERGISGAPVVDTEGRLKGVLSKTDLVTHHHAGGEEIVDAGPYRLDGVRGAHLLQVAPSAARDIMTPVPCVAAEWATLGELAALMVRREVHRVVICRDRKVVGIVSSLDILRAIAEEPALAEWDPKGFPG
ncbi:MAG TPA: CBS domain-containing protein [Candidatus Polarisedimenticolia bacterium]|nr:CBS domain-containing protein [Candidatus Polarisedimenticolia bacterium]